MKTRYFKTGLLFAAIGMLFTACDSDRDDNPTLGPSNTPTEFVLNASPLSEQYIYISKDNKLNLTWSQPNYAFNVPVNYYVQVGVVDNGTTKWNVDDNGQPQFLDTSYETCSAALSGEEISQAINHVDGITDENNWVDPGYREIAFRLYANVQTTTKTVIDGTGIYSNAVTFKYMRPDNSIKGLASLYVIGNCSGWTEPAKGNAETLAAWRIMETEIGSNIFHGTFEMPAGMLQFRFYSKLTGWDGGDSYGTQVDDAPIVCNFDSNGAFTGAAVVGKGSWEFDDFPGGTLDITVNKNKNTVTFQIVQ
ncbi:MAG: SusE domain-containing protein [Prevotella sp.]|nr:SusE domain-containing protein [Prevotella sp.]